MAYMVALFNIANLVLEGIFTSLRWIEFCKRSSVWTRVAQVCPLKSMSWCFMSHQHTEGEQIISTEILEQHYINGHRNSRISIFLCSSIVNGKAGSIINTCGSTALGVQQWKAYCQLSTSIIVLAACTGFAVCTEHHSQTTEHLWAVS